MVVKLKNDILCLYSVHTLKHVKVLHLLCLFIIFSFCFFKGEGVKKR